jgi:hypothetical protein
VEHCSQEEKTKLTLPVLPNCWKTRQVGKERNAHEKDMGGDYRFIYKNLIYNAFNNVIYFLNQLRTTTFFDQVENRSGRNLCDCRESRGLGQKDSTGRIFHSIIVPGSVLRISFTPAGLASYSVAEFATEVSQRHYRQVLS